MKFPVAARRSTVAAPVQPLDLSLSCEASLRASDHDFVITPRGIFASVRVPETAPRSPLFRSGFEGISKAKKAQPHHENLPLTTGPSSPAGSADILCLRPLHPLPAESAGRGGQAGRKNVCVSAQGSNRDSSVTITIESGLCASRHPARCRRFIRILHPAMENPDHSVVGSAPLLHRHGEGGGLCHAARRRSHGYR